MRVGPGFRWHQAQKTLLDALMAQRRGLQRKGLLYEGPPSYMLTSIHTGIHTTMKADRQTDRQAYRCNGQAPRRQAGKAVCCCAYAASVPGAWPA